MEAKLRRGKNRRTRRAKPAGSSLGCGSLLRPVGGEYPDPYTPLPSEGPLAGPELCCLQ